MNTNFRIHCPDNFLIQIQQPSLALSSKIMFLYKVSPCPPPWSCPWTCNSTSADQPWQQLHSSSLSCLCSDMSLYSFGLEPLSCHTWNKDRTRRWNSKHTKLAAFPSRVTQDMYVCTFLNSFSMDSIKGGTTLAMQNADAFSPPSNCINASWRTTGNLIINTGNGLMCTSLAGCLLLFLYLTLQLKTAVDRHWLALHTSHQAICFVFLCKL